MNRDPVWLQRLTFLLLGGGLAISFAHTGVTTLLNGQGYRPIRGGSLLTGWEAKNMAYQCLTLAVFICYGLYWFWKQTGDD